MFQARTIVRYIYAPILAATLVLAGSGVAVGQCTGNVAGTSNLLSGAAWEPATVPDPVAWPNNYPPTNGGGVGNPNCAICPSLFSIEACAGNMVPVFLCQGNIYRISMCYADSAWNSTLTVTNGGAMNVIFANDDDGCGVPGQHAQIIFAPSISQQYRIRLFENPCLVNSGLCGTLEIECIPPPPAPPNTDPCGAFSLPVNTNCVWSNGTTEYYTTSSIPPPGCGSYAGVDAWHQIIVPASGNVSFSMQHGSQQNFAMAAYVATGTCADGNLSLTQIGCNATSPQPGVETPYLAFSGLVPGTRIYIRVWPEGGQANGGPYQICARTINPPPNDNPCGAIPLPVNTNCAYSAFNNNNATPLTYLMNTVPALPSCGLPVASGDVWFSVVMPATGSITINSLATPTTDMAMAAYELTSGDLCTGGTLTQVACNDNTPLGSNLMPRVQFSGVPGQTYYLRMWNKVFTNNSFQICAQVNNPPPNDEPCGAINLTPNYGCLFSNTTMLNSTQSSFNTSNVVFPPLSCGGLPFNDVWYSAVVPPNGIIQFNTEPGTLNDAAMALYTVVSGSCAAGNLVLQEEACSVAGSSYAPNMPYIGAGGLTPGSIVYVRIWRELEAFPGTFGICARRTDVPPSDCVYILRMYDSALNGWGGSVVRICVNGVCTNYTITGGYGEVVLPATIGQTITLQYIGVGTAQGDNSFTFASSTGAVLYESSFLPTIGIVYTAVVDPICNAPPSPPGDCIGAYSFCEDTDETFTPVNTGDIDDLNPDNDGCLDDERMGMWFTFNVATNGKIGFSIVPQSSTYTDYDFAVWGPTPGIICPPQGPPIRCSWAPAEVPFVNGITGLNYTALDESEGLDGDGWVSYIDVFAGETYMVYVDNFGMNGAPFELVWDVENTATVGCLFLPVELLAFTATAQARQVDLEWTTASEQHSSHFVVERSTDLATFTPLGTVPAAGYSSSLTRYSFVDDQPLPGVNYYRLRQVDLNGMVAFSHTVSAVFNAAHGSLLVYPNPAQDEVQVTFDHSREGSAHWRISDASGRRVREGGTTTVPGTNQLVLDLRPLDRGSYLLELHDASGMPLGTARFVKQ